MALDQYGRDDGFGDLIGGGNPLNPQNSFANMFAGLGRDASIAAPQPNTSALPGVGDQNPQTQRDAGTPNAGFSGTTRILSSAAPAYSSTPVGATSGVSQK